MSNNAWGKYKKNPPSTHYDPLTTFLTDDHPFGFRVNFLHNRHQRPREQYIDLPKSYVDDDISEEEIQNSPLYRVLHGKEPCVPIVVEDKIIGDPDDPVRIDDFSDYRGMSIMNKFAPLGLFSDEATGVALVNFPNTYTRTLDCPQIIYDLLLPMKTSISYLLSGKSYRDDLKAALIFFNIGPSSGASVRYLHGQSYIVPQATGLNTYGYMRAFEEYSNCLTCRIANDTRIVDIVDQEINYEDLTAWEDSYFRLIYPHAPMRSMATRIIPKQHVRYIGEMNEKQLKSLSNVLSVADYLMNAATPSSRSVRKDRTVTFRQTSNIDKDFHMFIDILPPFPFVAAETVDFLGLTPFKPKDIAKAMREISIDHIEFI